MHRTIPACPEHKPEVSSHHPNEIEQTYTIEVITPLFGGGVETGVNDPVTLIRPSSIRGHLRFWWRAICGRRYENVQDLRMAEAAIWGSTEFSSPVSLSVAIRGKKPSTEACQVDSTDRRKHVWNKLLTGENTRNNLPGYVLFPFQGKKKRNSTENDVDPKTFIRLVHFELNMSLPDDKKYWLLTDTANGRRKQKNQPLLPKIQNLWQEINTAVWAWVNFGGIGARTRRGCGAYGVCWLTLPPWMAYAGTGNKYCALSKNTYRSSRKKTWRARWAKPHPPNWVKGRGRILWIKQPIDFEDLDWLRKVIQQIIRDEVKQGIPEEEIIVDATGAQKTTSIAVALATLNSKVTFQYVQTTDNPEVIVYDVVSEAPRLLSG